LLVLCAVSIAAGEAAGQIQYAYTLEKLGILDLPGTGGRPYAMGGAYTAVGDDAFALLYNPAALAQVKRKELSFGFHHTRNDYDTEYLGFPSGLTSSSTTLGHVASIYPYPTYRGSVVLGFGVFRIGGSDRERMVKDVVDIDSRTENLYTQSGSIYQYHFGIGVEVSPRVSLGVGVVVWDQSLDFIEEIISEGPDSIAYWTDDVKLDLDGVSANIGVLIRINEHIRTGLSVSTPTWISYDGDAITSYEGDYKTGPFSGWTSDPENFLIDEEYTLPMTFRGGLALHFDPVLVSADVSFIPYSQTKREGLRILDEFSPGGDHAFDDVWNFHLGAELTLPWYPVRLRGGYAYTPLALSTIDEITRIIDDSLFLSDDYFTVERENHRFTFGAGVLIDRVLTLDAGVAIGGYERDTGDLLEDRSIFEVVVSGAYRF
jgi:hypothetical protein